MRAVLLRLDGGRHSTVEGVLRFPPATGSPIVLMVGGGFQEFVTTSVERILRVVGTGRVYIETRNSTYRLDTCEDTHPGRTRAMR